MFVTRYALQQKYPAAGLVFSGSDVVLDDATFAGAPRYAAGGAEPFTLVSVASLDQPYKGIGVLLEAVRRLRSTGRRVKLLVAGGGVLMPSLQEQAQSLGVRSDVEFLGQLDRNGVRRALDAAHLFVLASLTEGLPRALLEAMACGLPAVSTNVGGIPELLPADCLVPPRDPAALARRIQEYMADDALRRTMGERNQQVARTYHEAAQAPIRRAFLRAIEDMSGDARREIAYA